MSAPSLCTKSQMIASIADRWKESYYHLGSGGWAAYGSDKKKIYDRLVMERPTTAAQIAKIIGNDSWTRLPCDGCKKDSELLVMVGEEPDFDSPTASICPDCLHAASELVRKATSSLASETKRTRKKEPK